MSWSEFLSLMLQTTNKVNKAAVFNIKGQPLAATEDLQVSEADGRAILMCLWDPARSLTRLSLDDGDFRCFQGNNRALVGKATNSSGRLLVAYLTDEVLIVVIGIASGHGSFLYEVQKNLEERTRRQLVPQAAVGGEGSQASQSVKPGPVSPLPGPPQSPTAAPVSQEAVLVQLHD